MEVWVLLWAGTGIEVKGDVSPIYVGIEWEGAKGTYDGADEGVAGDEGDCGAGGCAGRGWGATTAGGAYGACRGRGSGETLRVVIVRESA